MSDYSGERMRDRRGVRTAVVGLLVALALVLVLGGGRIRGDIPVRLERPRDITAPDFNTVKRQVLSLLSHLPERSGDSEENEQP